MKILLILFLIVGVFDYLLILGASKAERMYENDDKELSETIPKSHE